MSALDATVEVFRRWLYLPDPVALYAVLGAVAANLLPGDPVWLLLVGPPGAGKSELLQPLGSLPYVHPIATLTEAALLSGTPKRERDDDSSGGLLREIGSSGIVLAKDFGSVLSMQRDSRAAVLAALREVYDGDWTRHLGTDGGRKLHWSGKAGLIAGCTPAIDRHHAVMGAMGERFVLVRLPPVDAEQQGHRALEHAGREARMRAELVETVAALFEKSLTAPDQRPEADRLVRLASLVVRCRSSVERNGYTREVELIPESETPTRLVVVLDRLFAGLLSLGIDADIAWRVVGTAALDSIPALRRSVIDRLSAAEGELTTAELAAIIGYPQKTTERTLDDLVAHGVVCVRRLGPGKATKWQLTEWVAACYAVATSPEMSGGATSTSPEKSESPSLFPCTHTKDKSGEVDNASSANGTVSDSTPSVGDAVDKERSTSDGPDANDGDTPPSPEAVDAEQSGRAGTQPSPKRAASADSSDEGESSAVAHRDAP